MTADTRGFAPGPTPPWRRYDPHYAWMMAHLWCAAFGPPELRRYHLRSFSQYAGSLGWPAAWTFSGP